MNISIKTHKVLWGRAANRCSICKTELVADKTESDDESVIGDECHISARSESGPRGDLQLSQNQRNTYANLILLCRNHHKEVDDQHNYYTTDRLRQIKAEHEAWVTEKLGNFDAARQHQEEIYASYIEEWEQLSHLDDWDVWASCLLSPQPYLMSDLVENLRNLSWWELSRVWPGRYKCLEDGFTNFSLVLSDLLSHFFEHAEKEKQRYVAVKFYRGDGGWNPDYDSDLLRYTFYVDLTHDLALELTRAANYVCDQVRGYVLPSYRIHEGRLLVSRGNILERHILCPEYRGSERTARPYPGLEKFKVVRTRRDICIGSGFEP